MTQDTFTDIEVNGRHYPVEVAFVKGRNSSVRIRNGRVFMKFSKWASKKQRQEMCLKFLEWANKKLQKFEGGDFLNPIYEDGANICTHNKVYEVRLFKEERAKVFSKLKDGVIEVKLPEKRDYDLRKIVEKVIIKDQSQYLEEVVDELNQLHFQEEYGVVRFKRMNSRFGSCSSKRNLNIAYRLLFAPREVFRYVCVHELAHLKEFNHSKRFWHLVEEAMPDYKVQEKWLKENGFMLG